MFDSDSDVDDVFIIGIFNEMLKRKQKKRKSKTCNFLAKRKVAGRFKKDFVDLTQNAIKFRENFHMDVQDFKVLYKKVRPFLVAKRKTRPKDYISAKEKLAAVLEYMACGSLQRHVASIYRISKQHFGKCIAEVCSAIIKALKSEIKPSTEEMMVEVANDFNFKWNLPNCAGSFDGKQVPIKCPKKAGSLFYNYKGFHSITLMAVADAGYRFRYIYVGAFGSEGDAAVFSNCRLGKLLLENKLKFPANASVGNRKLPFFFIGDDAFPMNWRFIKPYVPKRSATLTKEEAIFNYCLSRARRCVENAFGILCSRFYCLARTMYCFPDRAQKIVAACCFLHNFLMNRKSAAYCPAHYADYIDEESGELIEGAWRQNVSNDTIDLSRREQRERPCEAGKVVRDYLKEYVNSPEGSFPWQEKYIFL